MPYQSCSQDTDCIEVSLTCSDCDSPVAINASQENAYDGVRGCWPQATGDSECGDGFGGTGGGFGGSCTTTVCARGQCTLTTCATPSTGIAVGTIGGFGSVGTTATFGNTGSFGSAATTTTTGGIGSICSGCFQASQCSSNFCNLSGFPDGGTSGIGFCDSFNICTQDPTACLPFGCDTNIGSCDCSNFVGAGTLSGTTGAFTGTTGTGTTGTGTTGSFLPICGTCQTSVECASNYCNLNAGTPGFCDSQSFCSPSACSPFGCDLDNGDCVCAGASSSTSSGTSASGTSTGASGSSSASGTGGSTGGPGICSSCTENAECASGFCNLTGGSPGFCDSAQLCAGTDCTPYRCDSLTGDCECPALVGTSSGSGVSSGSGSGGSSGSPSSGSGGSSGGEGTDAGETDAGVDVDAGAKDAG